MPNDKYSSPWQGLGTALVVVALVVAAALVFAYLIASGEVGP